MKSMCAARLWSPWLAGLVLVVAGLAGPASAVARPAHPVIASAGTVRAGVITTIAGGAGGPAAGRFVAVNGPCGVAFGNGAVYVTESAGNLVRRLDPGTGMLGTVDGNGGGPTGALNNPCGAAVDAAGNLVFADTGNNVVRVKASRNGTFYGVRMQAGHVYIVAGGGAAHGAPATRAVLLTPTAVAVDRHGNLLVSSDTTTGQWPYNLASGSAVVQVVGGAKGTFYGQRMVPGGIYTIAGNPCAGSAFNGCQDAFAGDGGPAAAALFGGAIQQIAVDASGNVLLTDSGNDRVRVIATSSRRFYGLAMSAGDIYTIAGGGTGGLGDGGPATHATLSSPSGVAITANGSVVVSDAGDQRIRLVAANSGRFYGLAMSAGDIYTIAGDGTAGFAGNTGPAIRAEVRSPSEVGVDRAGNVVIADSGNNRVRLVAATTGIYYGQHMTVGHIYTVAGNGQTAYSGDGGPATKAQLSPTYGSVSVFAGGPIYPGGVAVSHAGNIVFPDAGNGRVRVVAEANGIFYGQKFTAGHIYTIAGNGTRGFSGDGGPATAARFRLGNGVATDQAGNVLVSDGGNSRVRVIAVRSGRFYGRPMTAGHVYTLAGGGTVDGSPNGIPATKALISPLGLAVDQSGNIVIANQNSVMVVAEKSGRFYGQKMTPGDIYTVSWQPTPGVTELDAIAVAVDHAGNLVEADATNVVQVLAVRTGRFYGRRMTAGYVYAVAGSVNSGGSLAGDGGPATKARLWAPAAVAVDSAGNVLIADALNNRIRVVAERTGTFYGKKMTAGDIYTVAGSGRTGGLYGDGGPATDAVLSDPCGVAPFGTGLVVLDTSNDRVRFVSG